MKSKIFEEHGNRISAYCAENRLCFDKLRMSPCCYNDENLTFLLDEPEKEGWPLDETPSPATLEIYLENGNLRFVQTGITHKSLGVTDESRSGLKVAGLAGAMPIIMNLEGTPPLRGVPYPTF